MVVFTTVLPPHTHAPAHNNSHAHTLTHIPDYSQHAAVEINGSSVAWPQVGGAWREKDPFESPATRDKVWGDSRQR